MAKNNTPENIVLDGCLRYLKAREIYHWRNNTGAVRISPGRFMSFDKVGSSDILGILPDGRLLCVECKALNGHVSPQQKKFLADVKKLGALAVIVRGWWELDEILRDEGYTVDGEFYLNMPNKIKP